MATEPRPAPKSEVKTPEEKPLPPSEIEKAQNAPAVDRIPSSPGDAMTANNEVLNTSGERMPVKTTVNRDGPPVTGARPGEQNSSEQTDDPNQIDSSSEPIESIVKERFYDEGGRLVREDSTYVYVPKKGKPYPYKLMRPKDPKLDAKYKKEFETFKKQKREEIADRALAAGFGNFGLRPSARRAREEA